MDGAVKSMTLAERIASVDPDIRDELIERNLAGRGMKHLATDYRISEATVRAIIRDSKLTDRQRLTVVVWERPAWNAVIAPGWQTHGELTAVEARVYPG